MTEVGRRGLDGLLELLSEQLQLRGTGVVRVGDDERIFVVFGHPLHAVAGASIGLEAVDAIGEHARAEPEASIAWTAGVTAGKQHSIAPADGVLERLGRLSSGHAAAAQAEVERATDRMEELGLRRLMAEEPVDGVPPGPGQDLVWGALIGGICASLEATLHLHASPLVDAVRRAEPEPRSILNAIDRARALPLRAVSRANVADLLDAAEAMVREKMAV